MKKVITSIVVAGIVLGIVALFWTGALDMDQIRFQVRLLFNRGRNVATSTIQGPQGDPRTAAVCRDNLKRIESSKRQVAAEKAIAAGAVSRDDVARKLGGALPVCPNGGTYAIHDLGRMPTCSVGSAGTPDKSDDHVILIF